MNQENIDVEFEKYLILIPCSGEKKHNGESPAWNIIHGNSKFNHFPQLNSNRKLLFERYSKLKTIEEVRNYMKRDSRAKNEERRMRKIEDKYQHAIDVNSKITNSPTEEALIRYNGELYKGLQNDSYDYKSVEPLISKDGLVIVSAMFGLLKPNDLIPDYELMMGDWYEPNDKKVYKFWMDKLFPILRNFVNENTVIFYFLSSDYKKAVEINKLDSQAYGFRFLNKDGKSIGLGADKARGILCRQILLNNPQNLKFFENHKVGKYEFSKIEGNILYFKEV